MAGKFFKIPFASTGDKTPVPDSVQADGSVSYSEGFGFDYERPDTDPGYKPVPRDQTNQIYGDITEAIGIIQAQGLADWSTDGAPYASGTMVRHNGTNWISISGNNSQTPGASGSTNWRAFGGNPSETIAGFMRSATQAETDAGSPGAFAITPEKLLFGFSISLGSSGYIRLPRFMKGFTFQWGVAEVQGNNIATDVTLNVPWAVGLGQVFAVWLGAAPPNGGIGTSPGSNIMTQIRLYNSYTANQTVRWFAVGS